MRKQILSIGAILLSVLIFLMGSGLLGTVLPVRAHLAGFSDVVIGLIGSAYFTGFVLGCFIGPRLLERVGHSRTFAVAAGLAAVTPLIQSLVVNEAVWILVRAVFGFACANLYMVIESWLNDRATNETRGRVFSLYLTVNFTGLIVGQALFAVGRPSSYSLFSLSAIFYALCLIPVGLTRLPQPKPAAVPVLRPWRMFKVSPVGVAGCIAVGLGNGAIWTLAPIYAHDHHLTKGLLAAFMCAFAIGGAVVQLPLGRLSDHMDRRIIIAAVALLAAGAGLALAQYGGRGPVFALSLVALFGMVTLPMYGLSVAHANDRLPREMFVEASATLLMINALASIAGPTIAALIIAREGTASLFVYTAAIQTGLALFAIWRIATKERLIGENHERFEPMLQQTSPGALELDPRGPEHVEGAT
ncbi:MAG TPA: MFS transporter [Rhizomicrobium sp.]|nr:MFS transporter [Rhizomicrobium sp.]